MKVKTYVTVVLDVEARTWADVERVTKSMLGLFAENSVRIVGDADARVSETFVEKNQLQPE